MQLLAKFTFPFLSLSQLDMDWIHPWIELDWVGKMDPCPTLVIYLQLQAIRTSERGFRLATPPEMQDAACASSVKFFYGRISRDEAEDALKAAGVREGLYLLRESVQDAGNYVLSICHDSRY